MACRLGRVPAGALFAPLLLLAVGCTDASSPTPDTTSDPVESGDADDEQESSSDDVAASVPDVEKPSQEAPESSDDAGQDGCCDTPPSTDDAGVMEDAGADAPEEDAGAVEVDAGEPENCISIQTGFNPANPTCLTPEGWEQRAAESCAREGLELEGDVRVLYTCDGGYLVAGYRCC